ncbi:MAG: hypothetical protein JW957_05520 [Candidatus Omnitrophica bacterium]|nr:hypothetical protein [Candidatus Omnitrophota bacterium]
MIDNIEQAEKMRILSEARKRIVDLQKEKSRIEQNLLRPPPMVPYALIEHYGECGKKVCRCHHGQLHGPYWYLSQHRDGKTRNIYVPKEKVEKIQVLADRYKQYEGKLTQLRAIQKEIMDLLKEIEKSAYVPPSKMNLKRPAERKWKRKNKQGKP